MSAEVEGLSEVMRAARRGILDPGSVVKRGRDYDGNEYGERLDQWQERALTEALTTALAARDAARDAALREKLAVEVEAEAPGWDFAGGVARDAYIRIADRIRRGVAQ